MSELVNGGPTTGAGTRGATDQTAVLGEQTRPVTEESTVQLVQHASEQVSRLVRDEFTLAKAELTDKARHGGKGAGLLGAGGLVGLYGLGVLIIAAVAGLAVVMPVWLSALIVGVVLLIVAGILALVGRRQLRQALPPTPEASTQSMRDDLDTVSTAFRGRGDHEQG